MKKALSVKEKRGRIDERGITSRVETVIRTNAGSKEIVWYGFRKTRTQATSKMTFHHRPDRRERDILQVVHMPMREAYLAYCDDQPVIIRSELEPGSCTDASKPLCGRWQLKRNYKPLRKEEL